MAGRKRKEAEDFKPHIRPGTPWFERVRLALDISHERLAQVTGLELSEILELCSSGRFQEAGDDDEAYSALLDYVNERIGFAITVRNQLQHKLEDDRRRRLLLRQRIKGTA